MVKEVVAKLGFVDANAIKIDTPGIEYGYVYAPNADYVNVGGADIIFCNDETLIINSSNYRICRGEWYLKDGFIYSKADKGFKYNLNPTGANIFQLKKVKVESKTTVPDPLTRSLGALCIREKGRGM